MSLRALIDKGKNLEPHRVHWKADSSSQVCTDASCGKEFNPFSRRKHHCRMCGYLFCQDCLFLERRLNVRAQPDPDEGVPSRVCRACFFDPAKPDETGNVFNRTEEFKRKRKAYTGSTNHERLDMQKLVKNLSSVQQFGVDFAKDKYVRWESDDKVRSCGCPGCSYCALGDEAPTPCGRSFKGVSEGKHHCRLCGKIFCDGCSRQRVALPPISDIYRYIDGHTAAAEKAQPVADGTSDAAGKQLRACEQCFNNCTRHVLLPIAVKKGVEGVKKAAVYCMYQKACEQRDSLSSMLSSSEKCSATEWAAASDALRLQLHRAREIVERLAQMSKETQRAGEGALVKSMELHFSSSLRDELLPRFKQLQAKFDGVRASEEEFQQQQQQQHDDEAPLDSKPLPVQSVDDVADTNSGAAEVEERQAAKTAEGSDPSPSAAAAAVSAAAAAAAANLKPASKPLKAEFTALFSMFGIASRPSSDAQPAQSYGARNAGSFNTKNLQGKVSLGAEEGERWTSGASSRRAVSQATMPEYLELRALKGYADGFEAFLGSEGQFTAEEFVQWCACEECAAPLSDASHALAVGVAIAGQGFFKAVDAGGKIMIFGDKSDLVWYFTGKWAGTPVQWAPPASDEADSFLSDSTPAPVSLMSSPARRIQQSLALNLSPAKSASSLDVIDDDDPIVPGDASGGAVCEGVDFFMAGTKLVQLQGTAPVYQNTLELDLLKKVAQVPNIMQTLWFLSLCCDAISTEIHSHSVLGSDVSKAIVSAAQNASAQLRTIFTALSKPGAEANGDDAAAALQRHKDRAKEKATSWQKDVSDSHDKWTVELTKRANLRFAQNFEHDNEMAAANEKAQVQVAAAALSLFKGACDSGTHLITMHTLSDEQSDALLKPCVDALQKLKAECESAIRQHNQPNDSVVQDAAAEFALRFSMVGSDIRQSVSSKWQTVRSTLTGKKSGP